MIAAGGSDTGPKVVGGVSRRLFFKACMTAIFVMLVFSMTFDVAIQSKSRQHTINTMKTVRLGLDENGVSRRPLDPSAKISHQHDTESSLAPDRDISSHARALEQVSAPSESKRVESAAPILSLKPSASPSTTPSARPKAKPVTLVTTTAVPTQEPKVLCIEGPFYGQTFNRIIQTANALTLMEERGGVAVGLDEKWTDWYQGFLDPRPDILFNYTTSSFNRSCAWSVGAQEIFLYYEFHMDRCMKYLKELTPKAIHREQAATALAAMDQPVTTVHRRNLDGLCHEQAAAYKWVVCPNHDVSKSLSVQNLLDICNLEYNMIANETQGTSVVLMTDGQVPKLDQTFARISNHSFPVETWMMVMSDVHYGNPFSTVDYIVYFWRTNLLGKQNTMRPLGCYGSAS
jgi:hypothetical protein